VTGALVCTTTTLGAWDVTSIAYAASSCVVNAASAGLSVGTGSSYTFTAKMINAAGLSTASGASSAAVAGTAPTAPTGVTAALDNANGNVNLSWTAPSSTGGSAVTYTIKNAAGNSVDAVITGTTATAAYTLSTIAGTAPYNGYFTVTATNGQGLTSSANSNTIFVGRSPAQVAGVAVSISGTTATVGWTAAPSSSYTAVTGYSVQLYTCTTATWSTTTCTASGSPKLVAGGSAATTTFTVAPGTYYAATVAAINGSGTGVAGTSTPVQFANAAPGTPVVSVTGKTNSTLSISWTSAANGAAVSATSVQLNKQVSGAATSLDIAANAAILVTFAPTPGTIVPGSTMYIYTDPTAPAFTSCVVTTVTATTANCAAYTHAALTATTPTGTTVTSAKVMVTSGTAIAAATATTYTFTGLASGVYSATVTTTNSVGTSTASAESTETQVNVAPTAATLAYTSTSAATISWTAATSTTVSTSTVVDNTTGKSVCTASGTAVSCTITAAQAAAAVGHTFSVYTTDASGMPTALSGATAAIAAAGAAGTPTAYGNASGVSLVWTAGSNANSYNIVGYPSDGSSPVTATSATLSYLFAASALTTGITYTFKIQSVNAAGSSVYGDASTAAGLAGTTAVAGTPTDVAVTSVAATNGASVTYSWTAGTAVVGNAVTSYTGTLTLASGAIMVCTTTTTSCTFVGATAATAAVAGSSTWLSFVVVANAPLGNSAATTALVTTASAHKPTAGSVGSVTATADAAGGGITVAWTAPTVNPSSVSGYQIVFTNTTAGATQLPFYCVQTGSAAGNLVLGVLTLDCANTGTYEYYTITATGVTDGTTAATTPFIAGNSYSVTVAAITANLLGGVSGSSVGNASATATVLAAPGAPTGVTAVVSGNSKLTISWTAPASTGGSAITGYVVTGTLGTNTITTGSCLNGTSTTGISISGSVITITGTFTSIVCTFAGTAAAATFTVAAINAVGTGTASSASTSVTVLATLAMTASSVFYGGSAGSAIALGWTAVTGATSYTVVFTKTGPTGNVTATTFAGITTTSYVVPATATSALDTFSATVAAVNAAGTGTALAAAAASVPAAPASVYNSQGGTSTAPTTTNLNWTASVANGLPVTYTIFATISGIVTQIGTTTGLTFSEAYTASHASLCVAATTAAGTSTGCTAITATYVGAGAPSAVTSLSAGSLTATAATLSWTAGATGTTTPPVTSYTVTVTGSNGTTPACTVASATSCTLVLLPNVVYTASVVENTFFGSSTATTTQFFTPLSAAGAPTVTSVTATDTTMTFAWTAPTTLGGASGVNSYLVAVTGGGGGSCVTAGLTCTVTGLTAGTAASAITFAVTPYTSFGAGTAATTFGTLTGVATLAAAAAPAAVTILDAGLKKPSYPAYGSMTINWVNGAANASPVTGFICSAVDGTAVNPTITVAAAATATSCTFTGMANVAYTVTVYALNAFSTASSTTGVASSTITSKKWSSDAPALFGGASAVSGTISIQGLAPLKSLNGGATSDNLDPTSYTATASLTVGGAVAGTVTCASIATPCTIVGLAANTTYYVKVVATTAAGASSVNQIVPIKVLAATAPASPTAIAATRNATGLAITWTAPASAGSGQLVGYWVTATDPLSTQQYSCPYNATYGLILAPATSCSISGLSVGSSYNISITAITQDGAGTKQLSVPATKTGVLYNVLAPEPVMATFLAVTAKQKSVSALSPAAKTALSGLISTTNDGAQITIAGYGTTKAIALARANAAANYLFNNGAAVHVTVKSVISKTVKTALVTVTVN
jgi:hypothetical protein